MAQARKRTNPVVVDPDPSPVVSPVDEPKKDRRSFPATEDGGVKWDGFKSDKHRAAMRALIEREAEALGMVKKTGDVVATDFADEKLNAAQIFTLVNLLSVPLAIRFTHCTPEQAATLGITDEDLKVLNKNGVTDRMIEKYLPSVQLGLEMTFSLALLSVAAGKFAAFNQARLADKMADAKNAEAAKVVAHPSGLIRAVADVNAAETAAAALA